jgi:hypothetical protein
MKSGILIAILLWLACLGAEGSGQPARRALTLKGKPFPVAGICSEIQRGDIVCSRSSSRFGHVYIAQYAGHKEGRPVAIYRPRDKEDGERMAQEWASRRLLRARSGVTLCARRVRESVADALGLEPYWISGNANAYRAKLAGYPFVRRIA